MKKLFNTKHLAGKLLFLVWTIILLATLFYATSCSSSKTIHKSEQKKDSLVSVAGKINTVKKSDSAFHNYGKKSVVKTDQGHNATREQESNTEVTTTDYRLLKVKTNAGDYFGPDIQRLNDSILAERRTTTKKKQQKTKTADQQKNTFDSIGISFIQGGDISKSDASAIDTGKITHVITEEKKQDVVKKTSWFHWWYLLILPIAYGVYWCNKKYSFLTKLFH